ncbi:Conserved_hypothetical protein [Hexamita inflata]|uniref:Uncharacterized protein n=1 Tax=Hexamita inflata TaxID=28002 RepID=A0AA86Q2Z0_9EUKA|nr:Conserved hypothetical protein [Hexamita inflata]
MQSDHSDSSDSFEIQCEESEDYSILSVQSNEQNEQMVENDENVNISDNNQSEVTAKMIIIPGLPIDEILKVKAVVPPNVIVGQKDQDICVFTEDQYLQNKLKETFPQANIHLVDSDLNSNQEAIKNQSTLNWRCFQYLNSGSLNKKSNVQIKIIYNSIDTDIDGAKAFAKFIAQSDIKYYTKPFFLVGSNIYDSFVQMYQSNELVDKTGKVVKFTFRQHKREVSAYVQIHVNDVEKYIDIINQYDKTNMRFYEMKHIQKRTFKNEDPKKFITLKLSHVSKTDVEKIENYLKQFKGIKIQKQEENKKENLNKVKPSVEAKEKKEMKVQQPITKAKTLKKEQPPKQISKNCGKAQVAQQIDNKNVVQFFVTINLHDMPVDTAKILEAALKPRIPQNCTFKAMTKGDLSIKCNQESLEQVKNAITTYSPNLIFTQKPVKIETPKVTNANIQQIENLKNQVSIVVKLEKYPEKAAQTLLPTILSVIPSSGNAFIQGVNIIIQIDPTEVELVESYLKCIQFNDQEIEFARL